MGRGYSFDALCARLMYNPKDRAATATKTRYQLSILSSMCLRKFTIGGLSMVRHSFNSLSLLSLVAICALTPSIIGAQQYVSPLQKEVHDCNVDAGSLRGQPRLDFMNQCLRRKSDARHRPQTLIDTCNSEANSKQLEGDARKSFLDGCLDADQGKSNSQ